MEKDKQKYANDNSYPLVRIAECNRRDPASC
jgi:hypothetical protein